MNPELIDAIEQEFDQQLAKALVLLHQLSSDAQQQITELMKDLRIRFAEAALKSGAITQEQLEEALTWIKQNEVLQDRGIIQEALRRSTHKRSPILWERDQLEPSKDLTLVHDPEHPHSEAVRSLRTEILLRFKDQNRGRMIALLSPSAHEGRSQLAAELAISFAQLGRRTLLVDADLRRPNQHRLFEVDNEIGLTQAMTSGGPHRFHGIRGVPEMALMTSGDLPPNPLELLSGGAFERTLQQWRRNFEFLVLDTPPATQTSDALIIAAAARNVLILGRAKVTRFAQLSEICRNLSVTDSRILGAVINRF